MHMSSLHLAPHGINLVVETKTGRVVVGRFDAVHGFEALLHDADVFEPSPGADPEHWIRETATLGVDVKHRDYKLDLASVVRWRKLGDIEKLPL
jgi:hypothetical protein